MGYEKASSISWQRRSTPVGGIFTDRDPSDVIKQLLCNAISLLCTIFSFAFQSSKSMEQLENKPQELIEPAMWNEEINQLHSKRHKVRDFNDEHHRFYYAFRMTIKSADEGKKGRRNFVVLQFFCY